MKSYNYLEAGTLTITTTGNIDALDPQGCGLILMNNASLATIRGIKAGYPGQRIKIVSIGAGEVDFAHQNSNPTAANRLINWVTSGITPLAAGVGEATYQYDDTVSRWRLVDHEQGAYITIPFSAGDWTGNGAMTVTVPSAPATDKFLIRGRTFSYSFFVANNITIGGTPNNLIQRLLPNGYTTADTGSGGPMRVFDNGTYRMGFAFVVFGSSTTKIVFTIFDLSNFALSTANSGLFGNSVFEIQ